MVPQKLNTLPRKNRDRNDGASKPLILAHELMRAITEKHPTLA
jgi:hypothetical protein